MSLNQSTGLTQPEMKDKKDPTSIESIKLFLIKLLFHNLRTVVVTEALRNYKFACGDIVIIANSFE